MRIGAWYDSEADELRVRLRGATRWRSRRILLALSYLLRYVPDAELRAMGLAIQATLEDSENPARECPEGLNGGEVLGAGREAV